MSMAPPTVYGDQELQDTKHCQIQVGTFSSEVRGPVLTPHIPGSVVIELIPYKLAGQQSSMSNIMKFWLSVAQV